MVTSLSEKQKMHEFIAQSAPACRRCKNFGSFACPNFQKAVEDDKLDQEQLASVIKKDQENVLLESCSNT